MHTHQYIGKIICKNGNKATADRIIDYIPGPWDTIGAERNTSGVT